MFKTLPRFWMKDKNTAKWLMELPCLFSSPISPSEIEALTDDVQGSFWD